jgi:glycosyltransferase involved in cell wall biosynthesis
MKEKTLLIVSTNFPPDARAGTQRVLRFTKYLVKLGWNISVLTLKPEFSLYKSIQDHSLLSKVPASVDVRRTVVFRLIWPFSGFNSYLIPDREVGWVPFAYRQGLKIIEEKHISCLYSSAPPWTTNVICWWLKRKTGIKWVADIRDPWTRRPWMPLEDRKGMRYAALKKIEKAVIHSADRVILNTQALHQDFSSYYKNVEQNKFITITNGIDPDDLIGLDESREPTDGPFVITHGGSLYRKRDPRPFLKAISELLRKKAITQTDLLIRFVGNIDPKFEIHSWVRDLNLEAVVRIEPGVPHDQYLNLLSSSHLLLLIQPDTDLQVPSKLFEYMAVGRPILALAHRGATMDIVKQYPRGTVVDPYNVEEIEAAMLSCLKRRTAPDADPVIGHRSNLAFSGESLSMELDRVLTDSLAQ